MIHPFCLFLLVRAAVFQCRPISADQSPSRNCISRPGVVIGMRTYLASVFPLFHGNVASCDMILFADLFRTCLEPCNVQTYVGCGVPKIESMLCHADPVLACCPVLF